VHVPLGGPQRHSTGESIPCDLPACVCSCRAHSLVGMCTCMYAFQGHPPLERKVCVTSSVCLSYYMHMQRLSAVSQCCMCGCVLVLLQAGGRCCRGVSSGCLQSRVCHQPLQHDAANQRCLDHNGRWFRLTAVWAAGAAAAEEAMAVHAQSDGHMAQHTGGWLRWGLVLQQHPALHAHTSAVYTSREASKCDAKMASHLRATV
jgi:hypothetical protein